MTDAPLRLRWRKEFGHNSGQLRSCSKPPRPPPGDKWGLLEEGPTWGWRSLSSTAADRVPLASNASKLGTTSRLGGRLGSWQGHCDSALCLLCHTGVTVECKAPVHAPHSHLRGRYRPSLRADQHFCSLILPLQGALSPSGRREELGSLGLLGHSSPSQSWTTSDAVPSLQGVPVCCS